MVNTWSDSGTGTGTRTGAIDLFLCTEMYFIYTLILTYIYYIHTHSVYYSFDCVFLLCFAMLCIQKRTEFSLINSNGFSFIWTKMNKKNRTKLEKIILSTTPSHCRRRRCRRHHLWFDVFYCFTQVFFFYIHTYILLLTLNNGPSRKCCYWLVQKYLWYHQQLLQWKTCYISCALCAQNCIQCKILLTEWLVNTLVLL